MARVMGYTNGSEVHRASLRLSSPDTGANARNVRNADDTTTTNHMTSAGHLRSRHGQDTARTTAKSGTLIQKITITE
jgi:hypothetical protein